jgi:hypothetical protein
LFNNIWNEKEKEKSVEELKKSLEEMNEKWKVKRKKLYNFDR